MSSKGGGLGILGVLIFFIRDIVISIMELFWKEVWAIVKIPYAILLGWYQLYAYLSELQTNLEVISSVLSIYNNFTSGLSFPDNLLQSVDPFGNLIWIGFWGLVFWYIGIPFLRALISIVSDLR
jgi:hypothetical protein